MAETLDICQQILISVYKLTLPLSMKGRHPVFHASELQKHEPDSIVERQTPVLKNVEVNSKEEWEVENMLDLMTHHINQEYLVSWIVFGTNPNSWKPRTNPEIYIEVINQSEFVDPASRH